MNGTLLRIPFNFTAPSTIHKKFDFTSPIFLDVLKDDILVITNELDYERFSHGGWMPASFQASFNNAFNEIGENEFKTTGKIKGFEALNLRTFDRLWIAHYDIKVLEEPSNHHGQTNDAKRIG